LEQPPLVLSIFPGIDLLGRAFEEEGFCVVRGPDILWGGDVRRFHPPAGHFAGVLGGPPCQAFSSANRCDSPAAGEELLIEFARVVMEAKPTWYLLENVPRAPQLAIGGYPSQRIDVRGSEVGLRQRRLRHFQFGCVSARALCVPRAVTGPEDQPAALASEGRRQGRRSWDDFCRLQGLPGGLELPGMTREARYRAVGNGVPLPMGRLLARSIRAWMAGGNAPRVCACGCGRPVEGMAFAAGVACRKRMERQRKRQGDRSIARASPSSPEACYMVPEVQ
jgi:DNA (cytosine-5)-methyltransferase 1